MIKNLFLMSVMTMLINLAAAPSLFAFDGNAGDAGFISKLQTGIQKQGTGPASKIRVKLADGTKLEGYISEIGTSGFVVVDKTTGQKIAIDYHQVKQAQGNHWSTRKGFFYGAIIGLAVIAVVIIVALNNDK